MQNKLNIGLLTYSSHSPVSFYRWHGVVKELPRIFDDIKIKELYDVSWNNLIGLDCIFFGKPYFTNSLNTTEDQTNHKKVIEMIKRNKRPLVVEYDDLLSEVPEESTFNRKCMNIPYKENFEEFINIADGVIFSTQYIVDYLKEKNILKHNNYTVINNAINHYQLGFDYSFSEYNKTIVWRGTSTHYPDFEPYIEQLISVVNDNADFDFVFIGLCPDKRLKNFPNVRIKERLDIIEYYYYLKSIKPSIMFVLLLDNHFNRAKSNCSKLEATYAGAVTLSPDFEEFNWKDETEISHFDTNNFAAKMEKVIDLVRHKDESIKKLYDHNRQYVLRRYMLRDTNIKRGKFLKEIVLNRR